MFGIKPLPLNSLSAVSLLLRFFQKYTSWVVISLGFLAEDRTDIEADYLELGTMIYMQTLDCYRLKLLARQWGSRSPSRANSATFPQSTSLAVWSWRRVRWAACSENPPLLRYKPKVSVRTSLLWNWSFRQPLLRKSTPSQSASSCFRTLPIYSSAHSSTTL